MNYETFKSQKLKDIALLELAHKQEEEKLNKGAVFKQVDQKTKKLVVDKKF